VRGLCWLLCLWLLGCACAEAQAGVLLFERAPLRPGLCAALRIQLTGLAEVRCVPDSASASLAERLAASRQRVASEASLLGVLLERDEDPRLVRMYLVTGAGEQAALAIERIEDRPEPDVDRSLSLKVLDAYELISFVDSALPDKGESAAAVLATPENRPVLSPDGQSPRDPARPFLLSFVELGGGLGVGDGVWGVANVLLGVGRASARSRYELALGARLSSPQQERSSLGSVSVRERGPLLAARLNARFGRFELGGSAHLLLVFAEAVGVTSDGEDGRENTIAAVLGLGPELRVRLFRQAYLRLAPSLELWTTRQRYAVDNQVMIDRGRFSLTLPLSLLISLPLEKTPEGFQP
jgi:hypothetical protein